MSRLSEVLESDQFAVTAEINPPKGVDIQDTLSKAKALRGFVDAVNLTDQQSAVMSMSPLALASLLMQLGPEVTIQVTCRDRNRIAIQGDLLGASALGMENILCMTGDPVGTGDHPDAKAVFDMDSIGLLRTASALMKGKDMGDNDLKGSPSFYLGAVVNPAASELADEIIRMEDKVEAGARFFQTQAIFDPTELEEFMSMVKPLGVPVLAGLIVLKSGDMARSLNLRLPGVHVPDTIIEELDTAEDKAQKGIEIAGRTIRDVKGFCNGVHIMAIGWERRIPQVLEAAGILAREGALGT
ncbi:5,10-methylenetetrahydrofolate reductase [SAR202 cluster bacterium AC-647-N09_OGT_505m]|nr:5,10-methylenetetrahydrofolate reductase [SAR202 cluster bacterium AC-647-N09_OGT_505m]